MTAGNFLRSEKFRREVRKSVLKSCKGAHRYSYINAKDAEIPCLKLHTKPRHSIAVPQKLFGCIEKQDYLRIFSPQILNYPLHYNTLLFLCQPDILKLHKNTASLLTQFIKRKILHDFLPQNVAKSPKKCYH